VRPIRLFVAALLLPLLLAGFAACGSGDENSGESGTITAEVLEEPMSGIPAQAGQWMVEIETDPDGGLAYTVEEVVVPPGNANFHLINSQQSAHDLTVEEVGGGSVRTKTVREGSAWRRLSLYEGKRYVFYCSVPGHREAGMRGRITVDPKLESSELDEF